MNTGIIRDIKKISGHIEQDDLWITLLKYLYHSVYWNHQMKKNTILHYVFSPVKYITYTIYSA